MNICIIGTGYIGLTEGLCFADLGHDVSCVDVDQSKIDKLNAGIPTIFEEGLEEMLKRNLKNNKIKFTTDLKLALKNTEVVFICVNTPENQNDGSADLSALIDVSKDIAKKMDLDNEFTFVIRSTVPVGTNKVIKKVLIENNPKLKFTMVSNPEFSKQGSAISDFLNPDRIIIGVDSEKAKKIMEKVYKPITDKGSKIFFSTIETAELIKYASNTFLAVKIAFINEIADICEKTGANVDEIATAMGLDKRISPYFLKAGPGFGGSCFPKDSIALSSVAKNLGLDLDLISAVTTSNKKRKINLANKVISYSKNDLKGKTIALLGLTFKANTDDTRYSPSLELINGLVKNGIKINAYDSKGIEKAKTMLSDEILKNVNFFNNTYDVFNNAELLIIATEWEEFKNLDYKKIYKLLNQKTIIDFRNILNKKEIEDIGFTYYSIGK